MPSDKFYQNRSHFNASVSLSCWACGSPSQLKGFICLSKHKQIVSVIGHITGCRWRQTQTRCGEREGRPSTPSPHQVLPRRVTVIDGQHSSAAWCWGSTYRLSQTEAQGPQDLLYCTARKWLWTLIPSSSLPRLGPLLFLGIPSHACLDGVTQSGYNDFINILSVKDMELLMGVIPDVATSVHWRSWSSAGGGCVPTAAVVVCVGEMGLWQDNRDVCQWKMEECVRMKMF